MDISLIICVVLLLFIILFFFINMAIKRHFDKMKLRENKNNKNKNLEKKQEEVESLKLDIEKEMLENKLREMKSPLTKICPYCGSQNDAKEQRCSKCGVSFGVDKK